MTNDTADSRKSSRALLFPPLPKEGPREDLHLPRHPERSLLLEALHWKSILHPHNDLWNNLA